MAGAVSALVPYMLLLFSCSYSCYMLNLPLLLLLPLHAYHVPPPHAAPSMFLILFHSLPLPPAPNPVSWSSTPSCSYSCFMLLLPLLLLFRLNAPGPVLLLLPLQAPPPPFACTPVTCSSFPSSFYFCYILLRFPIYYSYNHFILLLPPDNCLLPILLILPLHAPPPPPSPLLHLLLYPPSLLLVECSHPCFMLLLPSCSHSHHMLFLPLLVLPQLNATPSSPAPTPITSSCCPSSSFSC